MSVAIVSKLQSFPLFSEHLAGWGTVLGHVRSKHFSHDDAIISHGDAAGQLCVVLSGWVKLVRLTPDGKETVVGLCARGDVFGEAALFAHASYPYSAHAIGEQTEVALVPASELRAALHNDPELSAHVMALLGERIHNAQLKIEQMSTLSAPQRLGCFLLNLCKTQGGSALEIDMPVEKHIIASYLGMKPETLSRSLQQLGGIGIKAKGPHISIANVQALQEFVCGSCGESGMCRTEEELTDATRA